MVGRGQSRHLPLPLDTTVPLLDAKPECFDPQRAPKATKREPARRRGDAAPHEQPAVLPYGVTPVYDPEKPPLMLSAQESDPLGWGEDSSETSKGESETSPVIPTRLCFSNDAMARRFPSF